MLTICSQFVKRRFVLRTWCLLLHVSEKFSYGVISVWLIDWMPISSWTVFSAVLECLFQSSCTWRVSSFSSLWQLCRVKQSVLSGDGWDPNWYAKVDSFCLNLGPFQFSKNFGSDIFLSSNIVMVSSCFPVIKHVFSGRGMHMYCLRETTVQFIYMQQYIMKMFSDLFCCFFFSWIDLYLSHFSV